jgi:hypothetical protein
MPPGCDPGAAVPAETTDRGPAAFSKVTFSEYFASDIVACVQFGNSAYLARVDSHQLYGRAEKKFHWSEEQVFGR